MNSKKLGLLTAFVVISLIFSTQVAFGNWLGELTVDYYWYCYDPDFTNNSDINFDGDEYYATTADLTGGSNPTRIAGDQTAIDSGIYYGIRVEEKYAYNPTLEKWRFIWVLTVEDSKFGPVREFLIKEGWGQTIPDDHAFGDQDSGESSPWDLSQDSGWYKWADTTGVNDTDNLTLMLFSDPVSHGYSAYSNGVGYHGGHAVGKATVKLDGASDYIEPIGNNAGQEWGWVTSTTTPEPSTLILLGVGLFSLAAYGYRRKQRQS